MMICVEDGYFSKVLRMTNLTQKKGKMEAMIISSIEGGFLRGNVQ